MIKASSVDRRRIARYVIYDEIIDPSNVVDLLCVFVHPLPHYSSINTYSQTAEMNKKVGLSASATNSNNNPTCFIKFNVVMSIFRIFMV